MHVVFHDQNVFLSVTISFHEAIDKIYNFVWFRGVQCVSKVPWND